MDLISYDQECNYLDLRMRQLFFKIIKYQLFLLRPQTPTLVSYY